MTLFSPWDLPLVSDSNHYSNFQCFLESVTPTIPANQLPKTQTRILNGISESLSQDFVEGFFLSSLWNFYTERSAYGVGVPILLNNGDSVLQYYCPSLSALEIYTEKPFISLRRLGKGCTAKQDSWSDESESDELSISLSNNSTIDITSDDSTTDQEPSCQTINCFGNLYCQYNETSSPYDRIPLTEKINELAQKYPGLLKFQSTDLSPYSWIAIAWYPIYQIPLTKNVKELSACFVTYHTLSSSKALSNATPEVEDQESAIIRFIGKEHTKGGIMRMKEGENGGERREIAVPPFAAAAYKMNGELWMNPMTSDHDKVASCLNAASSWLKFLNFQHHDFNFFMSRRIF